MTHKNISIYGGGRWARVVIDTILNLDEQFEINIYTKHNLEEIKSWYASKEHRNHILITKKEPEEIASQKTLAVIVNAANSHHNTAIKALNSGCDVLVEKPLSLKIEDAINIKKLSRRKNCKVYVSNVLFYCKYIANFKEKFTNITKSTDIKIIWADPKEEIRYGESKNYDSSINIIADVFPHIDALLYVLLEARKYELNKCRFLRGGARAELYFSSDNVRIHVILERNASDRKRLISIKQENNINHLDFTDEPGVMNIQGSKTKACNNWQNEKRPMSQLLVAAINSTWHSKSDSRLSVEHGIRSCKVIDKINQFYLLYQADYINKSLTNLMKANNNDLRYALTELVQRDKKLSHNVVASSIKNIMHKRTTAGIL